MKQTTSIVNRVKTELASNNVVCGCMVAEVRTPAIAMILESAGLDFFIIDMEHGTFNYESMNDMILACRGLRIAPFVRVPAIERQAFQKPLDAGAAGLLVPRVETKQQVEECLDFMRYAPAGSRGLSLRRAHSGFTKQNAFQFTEAANDNVMLMVQIETERGVENIDSICEATGIDVLFVGPSDLTHSYGEDRADAVQQAIQRVIEVGKRNSIATGIHHADLDLVAGFVEQGMRFISGNTEVGAIISVFAQMEQTLRRK